MQLPEHGAGKGKKRRRESPNTLKHNVNVYARDGDAKAALALYEKVVGQESISQHTYNVLLGLCAGIVTNHEHQSPSSESHNTTQVPAAKAFEVFEQMKKDGVQPNETTYTALIRASAKCEEPERGFMILLEMSDRKVPSKLRSYTPLLQAFADKNDLEGALKVDAHMSKCDILPAEEEYKQLVRLYASACDEEGLAAVLRRMRKQLTFLSEHTISILHNYYNSQKQYRVNNSTISDAGFCSHCGTKLGVEDLTAEEFAQFASQVESIALQRGTSPKVWDSFKAYLRTHGPFTEVIDGSNVAFFKQSFSGGSFQFNQLGRVYDVLRNDSIGDRSRKPLVVLHKGRTVGKVANSDLGRKVLGQLGKHKTLFTSPGGANDDWFWLYAAVAGGENTFLISNDQMRDHIFQLLGPRYVHKWIERHQVKFDFVGSKPHFSYPPRYSRCIQEDENGWHFPSDGTWSCVRRTV